MSEPLAITKTVLITGAAGFIGTNLCRRILATEPGTRIIAIDNLITSKRTNLETISKDTDRLVFLECDVVDSRALDAALNCVCFTTLDEIYHLASIASPPKYKQFPIETIDVNVQGTRNMLELASKHGAKMLLTSTSEVYGDPKEHPQKESYYGNVNIVGERSCYDESKRCAETYVYEYGRKYGTTNFKICRLFNTYGPYMDIDDGRVVTNFIKSILLERPLTVYGDGTQTRSFCYIEDTLDGIMALMASNETGPFNIGNPYTEMSIQTLIRVFETRLGLNAKVAYVYEPRTENDPAVRRPDITLAKSRLGFDPKWSIESGLLETFAHFSSGFIQNNIRN